MVMRRGALGRHPDFLKLWGGQTVSLVGSQITLLALPVTASLVLGAGPLQMGLLAAAGTVPALLFGLPAGAWLDRGRRRPVMIGADLGRSALLAAVPLAAVAGLLGMPLLYAVAFLVGALTLLFDVAAQSYLPALVPPERLVEGNARLELSRSAAGLVGPGLGGWLAQALTPPIAIAADALSFLVSALSLATLRTPEPAPAPASEGARLADEVGEGLRLVVRDARQRALAGGRATLLFFNDALEALFVLYLTRTLGIGPALLGLIFSIGSVGFLVGALAAGPATRRLGLGATLAGAPLLIGMADLFVPLAGALRGAAVPLLVLGEFLFGLARPVYQVNQVSLRQAITPPRLLGRVNASIYVLSAGTATLGALLGGVLGQRLGFQPTLIMAAVGEALAGLWALLSPLRAVREATPRAAEAPVG